MKAKLCLAHDAETVGRSFVANKYVTTKGTKSAKDSEKRALIVFEFSFLFFVPFVVPISQDLDSQGLASEFCQTWIDAPIVISSFPLFMMAASSRQDHENAKDEMPETAD